MNALLEKNTLSVNGMENALSLAKELMKQNYQVMIQHDDMDVYIVAYAENNLSYGADRFALITYEEEESILDARETEKIDEAKRLLEENNLLD